MTVQVYVCICVSLCVCVCVCVCVHVYVCVSVCQGSMHIYGHMRRCGQLRRIFAQNSVTHAQAYTPPSVSVVRLVCCVFPETGMCCLYSVFYLMRYVCNYDVCLYL
jgi:hypothetical protein